MKSDFCAVQSTWYDRAVSLCRQIQIFPGHSVKRHWSGF